jgi:hypothetical protein
MDRLKENAVTIILIIGALGVVWFLFHRPSSTVTRTETDNAATELEIVALLPKDAIPAIDDPRLYPAEAADQEYDPQELVLGVSINGEHRAYSTALLNGHEVVNDTLGGEPIAVTW